jgi:hypothetical protein
MVFVEFIKSERLWLQLCRQVLFVEFVVPVNSQLLWLRWFGMA